MEQADSDLYMFCMGDRSEVALLDVSNPEEQERFAFESRSVNVQFVSVAGMIKVPGRRADKTLVIDFSVPLAGMTQATNQVNQTASTLAKSGFSGTGDTVDLSTEMVTLIQARQDFAVNADTLQTEGQLTKSLLDAVG